MIVDRENIQHGITEGVDIIVLSGSSGYPIVGNEQQLQKEMLLVRHSKVPVIGICYGCELIVNTFGGVLEQMNEKKKGIIDIEVIVPDPIFGGRQRFEVYEGHRWRIKELPVGFIDLARSKHGIEAVKHKELPIYGLQFHPEKFVDETYGDEILRNIIKQVVSTS